jgi:hypothetical protein
MSIFSHNPIIIADKTEKQDFLYSRSKGKKGEKNNEGDQ